MIHHSILCFAPLSVYNLYIFKYTFIIYRLMLNANVINDSIRNKLKCLPIKNALIMPSCVSFIFQALDWD